MEKKLYEEPVADVLDFEICDVISDSITPIDGGEGDGPEIQV